MREDLLRFPPQMAELPDGSLMLNIRNTQHDGCRCRLVARSADGGRTFPAARVTADRALVEPSCAAALLLHGGTLFFSNPSNPLASKCVHAHLKPAQRTEMGLGLRWEKSHTWAYTCTSHYVMRSACPAHFQDSSQSRAPGTEILCAFEMRTKYRGLACDVASAILGSFRFRTVGGVQDG